MTSTDPAVEIATSRGRLTSIETFRSSMQPNVTIIAVTDDQGNTGLGETFYGASSVESYVHDVAAHTLAQDPEPSPTAASALLAGYVGYSGSGAEARGNSAIDIALWDLLAKRAGLPLRELLGGPNLDSIPVYNTCAGNNYVNAESRQASSNWGIGTGRPEGSYEDLWGFLNEPARLARELVDQGYPGMKVWPFDLAAEASRGDARADLREGLRVLDAIRDEVGDEIELYLELHSLWTLPGAERLFRQLERFDLTWAEDPIRADHVGALKRLASVTDVPIGLGENVGIGLNAYRPLLEADVLDTLILDLGWNGGITNGLKIAALAEQYGVPVAPHDCTGPISLAVATHFVTAVRNGAVQEVARAFYHGWYQEFAEGLPTIKSGRIRPSAGPGHGVVLTDAFLNHVGTVRRCTAL